MRRTGSRHLRRRHHDCLSIFHFPRHAKAGWRPGPFCFINTRTFNNIPPKLNSDPHFLTSDIDPGFLKFDQSREAILERAKVHGIETLDKLAFEADLGTTKDLGERLLDDSANRQDLDLWAVVLDYRQMVDGPDGVQDVLASMLYRGAPVMLHTDSVSEHIWQTVLPIALQEANTLYKLCQVGSSLMQHRPFVFRDIVGHFLTQDNLRMAIISGTQLLSQHFRGHSDLMHFFNITFQLGSDKGMHNFSQLLSRLPFHQIYGDTIHLLWSAGRKRHAFALHRHLLSLGDHPADFSQIEPFIRDIAKGGMDVEPFLRHLESHGVFYSYQARRLFRQERARFLQSLSKPNKVSFSSVPDTRPVKLSDAFVARTFATRSVSSEFVLSGLKFIGLFELGPLAVRELALAAGGIEKLRRYFQQLNDMEIDLGASAYVRVIRSLCLSSSENLLKTVLNSDMHHEAFEDIQMQKRLLRSYVRNSKWSELSRTLTIINKGEQDREAESRSNQLVLQMALIEGDWRGAIMSLDDMRKANQRSPHRPCLAPLRHALRRVWSDTDSRTRTSTDYLDRPLYLIGFMQFAQTAGLTVYPWQWRSVLHTIGRSQDWNLFQNQIVTIARMFQAGRQSSPGLYQTQDHGIKFALDDLFDRNMQSFIVEIGLTAGVKGEDPQLLWLRGLALLRNLANRFKLNVNYDSVRSAFRDRLYELFTGAEAGMRRRLISHYLRCFDWAWLEADVLRDQGLSHSLRHDGIAAANIRMLDAFQSRARRVPERRNPIASSTTTGDTHANLGFDDFGGIDVGDLDLGAPLSSSMSKTKRSEQRREDHDDAPVFYEDLLHPSYRTG